MKNYITLGLLMLSQAAAAANDPVPVASEYLRTVGGGTAVETKGSERVAYLGIIVEQIKALPVGAVLVAEFETPVEASTPNVITYTPRADEKKITLRSDSFNCIVPGRDLRVVVKILDGTDRRAQLSVHEQLIGTNIPERMVKQLGLRICAP